MKQKLHIFMTLLLLLVCGGASFGQNSTVTDELTFGSLGGKTGTNPGYADFSGKSLTSSAVYAGNYASTNSLDCIQIRSKNSNSGIVTTTSGGTIKSIKIEFNKGTNTLDIYGKNTAYASASDLYDSSKQGTKIGSANSDATITPTTSCNYIGIRSNKGAIYISKIIIEWEVAGSDKTPTKLSFGTDYDGKTISTKAGEMLETPATLTPAVSGATISYDSSDKTVAEIDEDGIVYAYKEGTTTITASYAGDDTYAGSSASYTLNVEDARTATTLTFPHASYTFTLGEQNGTATIEDNVAVLTPADAQVGTPVVYSVEGTEGLAELIGSSVLVNTNILGTATVTATYKGNDNYRASEASYTITVKELKEAFDFSKPANYGYDTPDKNTKNVNIGEGGKIVAGNVTITNVEDGGTATRFYYDTNKKTIGLRAYINAKLTVSVPNGYIVTDIKITPNATDKCTIGALNKSSVDLNFSAYLQMQSMTVTYAKLPTATLTTAASGFATYAADYDVNYSDAGLTAYAITLDEAAKTVKYTEATGVVPAGKAVLVKGEAKKEYTLAPATEEASDFTTDLLISDGKVTTADGLYYAFATVNGKSGFKVLADGLTIPAKKGYLKLSAANAKGFFELEGGEATGISEIEAETADDNAAIYNLAGQRVGKGYKGIAIKNGKKFVK